MAFVSTFISRLVSNHTSQMRNAICEQISRMDTLHACSAIDDITARQGHMSDSMTEAIPPFEDIFFACSEMEVCAYIAGNHQISEIDDFRSSLEDGVYPTWKVEMGLGWVLRQQEETDREDAQTLDAINTLFDELGGRENLLPNEIDTISRVMRGEVQNVDLIDMGRRIRDRATQANEFPAVILALPRDP